ncbi:hypothetical protein PBV88_55850, partial [Streptomyces sp. T21Q-yed]|nr:hypothetical protein [Streptomyces sp. T21Q-yed]
MVPAALTGGEAEIAGARESLKAAEGLLKGAQGLGDAFADVPPGELRARASHADLVLAVAREELTSRPYDPLDLLRRIV